MGGSGELRRSRGRRRILLLRIGAISLLLVIALAALVAFEMHYAQAILRARVIETLSARFQSRVTLSGFHVSVAGELEVFADGLNIYGKSDLNIHQPGIQPMLRIQEFRFRAGFFDLLHTPMRVQVVYLKGLQMNIPPVEQRQEAKAMRLELGKIKIYVDQFVCEQAQLVINTLRLDKLPLQFDIGKLILKDLGPGQPLRFDATLINPKPVGEIHSSGLVGPWQPDAPRDMPVQGTYSFTNADLATIKGIGGILSSTGKYQGTLGRIVVDGESDTPDFRVAVSGHPVPLHTDFNAIVDGTSGDTYLEPVKAKILNSFVTAKGSVVRTKEPNGHRVNLDVEVENSRIEDLLKMAVRTEPPVVTGTVRLRTQFDLRPGEADISDRLKLAGNFQVSGIHFTNDKVQAKVNALSMRSQGKPELAKVDLPVDMQSIMKGIFRMENGTFRFSQLQFFVPGTEVDMTGKYSLDGSQFDFHGHARMDAKLSQMVGGWKSILLKPVDPFFSKHGAGTEIPMKVTGTKSEPHFGLDFGRKK
jgi:hypothetical protein